MVSRELTMDIVNHCNALAIVQIRFLASRVSGELGFVAVDDLAIVILEANANANAECPQLPGSDSF